MSRCIAYEGSYNTTYTTSYGRKTRQDCYEVVLIADYGVVHYKVCSAAGGDFPKIVVFTDLDTTSRLRAFAGQADRDAFLKHQQFGRTKRSVAKGEGLFAPAPWGTTEELFEHRLQGKIELNEKAMNAWRTITGQDSAPGYSEIVGRAEEYVQASRQEHLRTRAVEMSAVDTMWGMF